MFYIFWPLGPPPPLQRDGPYWAPMVQLWMLSDKWLQRYRLLENFNTEILVTFWRCTRYRDLAPPPVKTLESDVMKWKLTLLGSYGPNMMYLPRYRLLENFSTKFLVFGDVLDFDLYPHPPAWTLESDVMEWKQPYWNLWSKYKSILISGCQDIDF